MKIDILSDFHLDFHLLQARLSKQKVKSLFETVITDNGTKQIGDILVVAGDIGHNNKQNIHVLKILKEEYYKHIICVLGNHDYYLLEKKDEINYDMSSLKRANEMKELINAEDNMYCLDGDTIEIDGIKFGGAMSWYDGMYMAPVGYDYKDPVRIWKRTMNDSKYIKGYDDFYDLLIQEKPKVEKILDVDVVITHVCPITEDFAFQKEGRHEQSNMFYAFSGEKYLESTRAKFWIFGHSHGQHSFEIHNTKCIVNTLGYKQDDAKYMSIEI